MRKVSRRSKVIQKDKVSQGTANRNGVKESLKSATINPQWGEDPVNNNKMVETPTAATSSMAFSQGQNMTCNQTGQQIRGSISPAL